MMFAVLFVQQIIKKICRKFNSIECQKGKKPNNKNEKPQKNL